MLKKKELQFGFTLIEILISLFLGSLLLAMVIGLYVTNVSAAAKAQKFSRLRTDMQALVGIMSDDIRRAGYGGSDFMVGGGKSKVIDMMSSGNKQCVIYAYNYDQAMIVNARHFMGFRYSAAYQSVQFANGVNSQASQCYTYDARWQNLSDPNTFKITLLSFAENIASNSQSTSRGLDITVVGTLMNGDEYSQKVQTSVQVRNTEKK